MSDVAGQILGEILGRLLAIAVEAAFRSAAASMNIGVESAATQPREEVLVQFPAVVELAATDDARIGRECAFDQAVAAYAFNFLGMRRTRAIEARSATSEDPRKTLRLVIVDIQDQTDRARGTRRSITVRADLVLGGAIVSSREFEHSSRFTKPDRCRVLDRIARPLGRDAASWLSSQISQPPRSSR